MSNQTVIRQTETGEGGEDGGGEQREEENKGMCWFHYEFVIYHQAVTQGLK